MTPSSTTEPIHHGRNIKRFREMKGMKQGALAAELGEDWSQKKISLLESKEVVDDALLQQVAKVLNITPELIKTFDVEAPVTTINNFNDSSTNQGTANVNTGSNYTVNCNLNPWDKLEVAIMEIKQLYERLLTAEREKNDLLKQLLEQKEK